MFTVNVFDEVREYNINEEDAYYIALQVLKEMEYETIDNPQYFNLKKEDGFTRLYKYLISRVLSTTYMVKRVSKED